MLFREGYLKYGLELFYHPSKMNKRACARMKIMQVQFFPIIIEKKVDLYYGTITLSHYRLVIIISTFLNLKCHYNFTAQLGQLTVKKIIKMTIVIVIYSPFIFKSHLSRDLPQKANNFIRSSQFNSFLQMCFKCYWYLITQRGSLDSYFRKINHLLFIDFFFFNLWKKRIRTESFANKFSWKIDFHLLISENI